MVKYQVITAAQALKQLQSILEYIIENDSFGKAQIAYEGIIETISALEVFPNGHSVYRTVKKTENTYRFIPKISFIFYFRSKIYDLVFPLLNKNAKAGGIKKRKQMLVSI